MRALILGFAVFAMAQAAMAADIQGRDIKLPATERAVSVTMFRAPGEAPRPSVLMLHGAGGFGRRLDDFKHYAADLAAQGFDAYLVNYYSDGDIKAMAARQDIFEARFVSWARLVDDLADSMLKQKDSNGRVGLVGFSNGGLLSVGASSLDPRITAAVIYYGAIPYPMAGKINRLPPLLILHGSDDQVIDVSAALDLQSLAHKLKTPVELKIYDGEGHGFGARPDNANTKDAAKRTLAFLNQRLKTK